ncbi:MAG: RnfABCDGE type electron transport complex subunit D [Victivallales bacterium]|nr:RnfABCDGE type electron transport complex subunit D [Victivallales bacterium]
MPEEPQSIVTPLSQPASASTAPAKPAPKPPVRSADPTLIVSSSPHFHTASTVDKIMRWVLIALVPGCLAGIYFFGLDALRVILVTTFACVLFEYLAAKAMKQPVAIMDGSAAVTGVLLAMNLPSATPMWLCLVGAFIAIVIGKMIYGGLGCNPFNPALVGRVALLIGFAGIMTTWSQPRAPENMLKKDAQVLQVQEAVTDPVPITGPTPLAFSKVARTDATKDAQNLLADIAETSDYQEPLSYWKLFLGFGKAGSLGETCGLALLLGGILLIVLKIIRWQIPVFYLGTVVVITGIPWLANPQSYANPLFHLLTGGLLLAAFFMATDMVTTPVSRLGAILFAIGCGVLTSCIRLWGSYPEGATFAILIMNAFTPLIDRYTQGRPFGMPKKKGLQFAK